MPHKSKEYYLTNRNLKSKIFRERKKITKLIKLAKTNWYSAEELSRLFNCSKKTIFSALYNKGIVIKNLGKFKRLYTYNERFFEKLDKDSAYWAGFIAADGILFIGDYNSKSVSIVLNEKDYDHLSNFLKLLKSNSKISKVASNNSVRVSFYSAIMFDSLVKLGIEPNKSLTISNVKIPTNLMSYFIRGVFDGDGSISGNRPSHIQICIAGNKPFLEQIQEDLISKCHVNKVKIYPLTQSKAYRLQYTGAQIFRILDYLYEDSTKKTRLKRKYLKYIRFKKEFKKHRKALITSIFF